MMTTCSIRPHLCPKRGKAPDSTLDASAARLLHVLVAISRPRSPTWRELAGELGVVERQARRYVAVLEAAGFRIWRVLEPDGRHRLSITDWPPALSPPGAEPLRERSP